MCRHVSEEPCDLEALSVFGAPLPRALEIRGRTLEHAVHGHFLGMERNQMIMSTMSDAGMHRHLITTFRG